MSAIFDFTSLLTVILLFICTCAFIRAATFNPRSQPPSFLDNNQRGLMGLPWKAARIGERLSPWVAAACMTMAVHVLLIK